jgi:MSHA biogenesis protein MshM
MEAAILDNQSSSDLSKLPGNPFGPAADGSSPYLSLSFREALAALYYGLECGSHILLLTADTGLGKTTLLRHFARRLHGRGRALFLSLGDDPGTEVLGKLLVEIGGTVADEHRLARRAQVDEILSSLVDAHNPFILLLDDVQNSERRAVETLRHLALLESFEKRLLRVVIAASSDLAEKLQASEFANQIRRVPLALLNAAEVENYIDYRLRLAGWSGGQLFTAKERALIAERSSGKPSAINEICFNLLYQRGKQERTPSNGPSGTQAVTFDEDYIDLALLSQQSVLPKSAHSLNLRTAALTSIILTLVLALAGLWYRSTIRPRAARQLGAHTAVGHSRKALTVARSLIAGAGLRLAPSLGQQQVTAVTAAKVASVRSVAAAEGGRAGRTADEMAADEIRQGDAYMNAGEYDKALGSFSKAVTFAPDNSAAREKVKRARRAKAAEHNVLQ